MAYIIMNFRVKKKSWVSTIAGVKILNWTSMYRDLIIEP